MTPAPASSLSESTATSSAPISSASKSSEPIASEPPPQTSSASSSSSSSSSSSPAVFSKSLLSELRLPPAYSKALPEPKRDSAFDDDVKRVRKNLNGNDLDRKLALLGEVWARELAASTEKPAAESGENARNRNKNDASGAMPNAEDREGSSHNGGSCHLANIVPENAEN